MKNSKQEKPRCKGREDSLNQRDYNEFSILYYKFNSLGFDLIQLIILDHLANMTVITTRDMIGNFCGSELLSSSTSAISENHTLLYQLQLRHYVQLRKAEISEITTQLINSQI